MRYAMPNARIMINQPQGGCEVRINFLISLMLLRACKRFFLYWLVESRKDLCQDIHHIISYLQLINQSCLSICAVLIVYLNYEVKLLIPEVSVIMFNLLFPYSMLVRELFMHLCVQIPKCKNCNNISPLQCNSSKILGLWNEYICSSH